MATLWTSPIAFHTHSPCPEAVDKTMNVTIIPMISENDGIGPPWIQTLLAQFL